ncbi:hypothetical protein [Endozoicomonas elysicola]|uniref:Uncharacterized protein n=1 Tax=Endozoicomonas elysicola TaxID=305900 RepID=A0A081K9Y0_9GAMM|nr:hypothetical protein [Endozoicomonas elysicola]KEI70956.1 hypothetical protein GV64_09580 [Endozoicomonas elysicola]
MQSIKNNNQTSTLLPQQQEAALSRIQNIEQNKYGQRRVSKTNINPNEKTLESHPSSESIKSKKITTLNESQSELDVYKLIKELKEEHIETLEQLAKERFNYNTYESKSAVSNFIIQIQEPKSLLHGLLTITCLLGAFGRHTAFILEEDSSIQNILLTMIGSLASGALSVDSVSGIPEDYKEQWQQLSGIKKAGIACYLTLLGVATASDSYRVGAEAHEKFGLTTSIFCGTCEGITIFGIGAEALKIIGELWESRDELKHQPKFNLFLITVAAITSAGSAYAFPFGVEQWTNSLLENHASTAFAYSPEGHMLLGGLMVPHVIVNFILETFVTASAAIGLKDVIKFSIQRACGYQLSSSTDSVYSKIEQLQSSFHHFFTSKKIKTVVNTLTSAALLSVAVMALTNTVKYQLALSEETRKVASEYSEMINNKTFLESEGISVNGLQVISKWASFDADFNSYMLVNTLLVQLYGATQGLINAAGMILGIPKGIYEWSKGPKPHGESKVCTEAKDPSLQLVRIVNFLSNRLEQEEFTQFINEVASLRTEEKQPIATYTQTAVPLLEANNEAIEVIYETAC